MPPLKPAGLPQSSRTEWVNIIAEVITIATMHTSAALLSMTALIAACILSSCAAICNPDNCSRDPCSDNIPNECKGAVRYEIFRKCPQEREHFAKCRISDKKICSLVAQV
jgi:hypothetical protein